MNTETEWNKYRMEMIMLIITYSFTYIDSFFIIIHSIDQSCYVTFLCTIFCIVLSKHAIYVVVDLNPGTESQPQPQLSSGLASVFLISLSG